MKKNKKTKKLRKIYPGGGPGARGPQDKAGKTQFIILSKTKSKKKEQQTNRKKGGRHAAAAWLPAHLPDTVQVQQTQPRKSHGLRAFRMCDDGSCTHPPASLHLLLE